MKKYAVLTFLVLSSLFSTLALSCSGGNEDDPINPDNVTPSNLTLDINIVGANNSNIYGDGTGVVNFKATATNAANYGFVIDNQSEVKNINGTYQYTFNKIEGIENHEIKVIAYSRSNKSIILIKTFAVRFIANLSNLTLDINIVGANNSNIYGDGTGVVNFKATATNAANYGFVIDNQSEVKNINGTYQYTFNKIEGIENHEIKVIAYSSSNNTINIIKTIAVSFYNGTPPIWADEFFENGAPNSKNWNYNLGAGGWGNNELQTYTNSSENVIVEDGLLKIIAKKDGSGAYTSARIKSENLFEFTYGTVEVRAKLPSAQGTWPAIWMLGANFDQVGWPVCGEIDIMEQKGWDKSKVLGTCHWSNNGNYAGYGLETAVTNATSDFHIYKLVWNQGGAIRIFVDNREYFVMTTNSSMPFNADFFFIFNIAMGGNLGGTIDPNFTQSTMEIDYIRVYQ